MRRLLLVLPIAALVAGTSGCDSVSARAFKVGSIEVSQSTFDDELALLHHDPLLAASVAQQQIAIASTGSIPSTVTTKWLGVRIYGAVSRHELSRRNDRVRTVDLDAVGLPTTGPYARIAPALRRRILSEIGALRALQRVLGAEPNARVQARRGCKSLRYVSHILVSTRADADAIKQKLDKGGSFGELARSSSIDTGSNQRQGALGCLDDLGSLPVPFLSAASTQPLDVPSSPVQTDVGFHIILVSERPLLDAVAVAEVQKMVVRTDVSIDPRYGRWDRKNGQVLPPSAPSG